MEMNKETLMTKLFGEKDLQERYVKMRLVIQKHVTQYQNVSYYCMFTKVDYDIIEVRV